MSNKTNKFKTIFALILSVGIFVPIWGTFHSFVGIQNAWAAFASAALFFATGHKIKESIKITVSHAIGLVWGLLLFILMGHPVFQSLNPLLTSVLVLGGLGILAVIITNLGENIFSHLPSLFCGWAVTVGSLGGVPVSGWGHQPVDILLSLIAGVIFLGIGISQFQALLCKIFNVQAVENPAVAQPASEAKVNKAAKEKVKKEEKSRQANSKYLSYVNLYHSENSGKESEQTKSVGDLSDIKSEISDIKNYLTKMPTGAPTGGFENTSVKIVGICGSPHKNGSTIVYIKKALEMAKSIGNVTTELIELAGKDIKPCMGCKSDKCLDKCKLNDAMQEIYPCSSGM